jgi:hypothetical protein
MGAIIIYWVYSSLWSMGVDVYNNHGKLTLFDFIIGILLGWLIMPMSYGTQRGKQIDTE